MNQEPLKPDSNLENQTLLNIDIQTLEELQSFINVSFEAACDEVHKEAKKEGDLIAYHNAWEQLESEVQIFDRQNEATIQKVKLLKESKTKTKEEIKARTIQFSDFCNICITHLNLYLPKRFEKYLGNNKRQIFELEIKKMLQSKAIAAFNQRYFKNNNSPKIKEQIENLALHPRHPDDRYLFYFLKGSESIRPTEFNLDNLIQNLAQPFKEAKDILEEEKKISPDLLGELCKQATIIESKALEPAINNIFESLIIQDSYKKASDEVLARDCSNLLIASNNVVPDIHKLWMQCTDDHQRKVLKNRIINLLTLKVQQWRASKVSITRARSKFSTALAFAAGMFVSLGAGGSAFFGRTAEVAETGAVSTTSSAPSTPPSASVALASPPSSPIAMPTPSHSPNPYIPSSPFPSYAPPTPVAGTVTANPQTPTPSATAVTQTPSTAVALTENPSEKKAYQFDRNSKEYNDFIGYLRGIPLDEGFVKKVEALAAKTFIQADLNTKLSSATNDVAKLEPTHRQVLEAFLEIAAKDGIGWYVGSMHKTHQELLKSGADLNDEKKMEAFFANPRNSGYKMYAKLWRAFKTLKPETPPDPTKGHIVNLNTTGTGEVNTFISEVNRWYKDQPAFLLVVHLALEELKRYPASEASKVNEQFYGIAEALATLKQGKPQPPKFKVPSVTLEKLKKLRVDGPIEDSDQFADLVLEVLAQNPVSDPLKYGEQFSAISEDLIRVINGKAQKLGFEFLPDTLTTIKKFKVDKDGSLTMLGQIQRQEKTRFLSTPIGRMLSVTEKVDLKAKPVDEKAPTGGQPEKPAPVPAAKPPIQTPAPANSTGRLDNLPQSTPQAIPVRTAVNEKAGGNIFSRILNKFKSKPAIQASEAVPNKAAQPSVFASNFRRNNQVANGVYETPVQVAEQIYGAIHKERIDQAALWQKATEWSSKASLWDNIKAKAGKIAYGLFGYQSETIKTRIAQLSKTQQPNVQNNNSWFAKKSMGASNFRKEVAKVDREYPAVVAKQQSAPKPIARMNFRDLTAELAAIRSAKLEDLKPKTAVTRPPAPRTANSYQKAA